jgi:hypothetical protein
MRARLALPLAALLVLALSACGPQVGSGPGGDDVDADPARPDAHPGTGSGCQTTPQCQGRLVCDPQTSECSDSIACTEHSDCGDAAHCADNGTCRKSQTGSPCDDESDCFGADDCFGGFCGCEGTSFVADPVPVNMLMVLDRSNSMQCHIDGTDNKVGASDPNSRWQAALGAIDALLTSYDDAIKFGFAVYPGLATGPQEPDTALCVGSGNCTASAQCTTGDRVVEVQSNAVSLIRNVLSGGTVDPGGCTPSGPSLQAQVGYDRLSNPDEENFILYITDGAENCSLNPNQVTAIQNLRNQDPEVRTFVVGFTEQVNPTELNAAAEAGGMARDGDIKYYQANDQAALTAALEEIGGLALSCSFTLDSVPPDLNDLFV